MKQGDKTLLEIAVRVEMGLRHWTVADLAKRMPGHAGRKHATPWTVYLNFRKEIPAEKDLRKMADALDIPLSALLERMRTEATTLTENGVKPLGCGLVAWPIPVGLASVKKP
jgi:hypothetical protein